VSTFGSYSRTRERESFLALTLSMPGMWATRPFRASRSPMSIPDGRSLKRILPGT
jgi:hypothetical protein